MKVFVTGGSGFIGGYVVAKLVARGHTVRCLARKTSDVRKLKAMGARLVEGDLGDRPSLREGMEGCDCAVHLAGLYAPWSPDRRDFFAANVEGARNVMEFALHTRLSKVVHVSTAAVWGSPRGRFDEDTPFGRRRIGLYAETKYRGELVAWQLRQRHRLPLVVVYPGAVVGPSDPSQVGELLRALASGRLGGLVFPRARMVYVSVDDAAETIVRAAEKEGNVGSRYIAGKEDVTLEQLLRWASEACGVPMPKRTVPAPVVLASAAAFSIWGKLARKRPPYGLSFSSARWLSMTQRGFLPDGSRAERELGVEYSPVRAAVEEAVRAHIGARQRAGNAA